MTAMHFSSTERGRRKLYASIGFSSAPGWRHRATIPNRDGYRVLVLRHDGGAQCTRVIRDPSTGLHRLEDIDITHVAGWQPDESHP